MFQLWGFSGTGVSGMGSDEGMGKCLGFLGPLGGAISREHGCGRGWKEGLERSFTQLSRAHTLGQCGEDHSCRNHWGGVPANAGCWGGISTKSF